MNAYRPLGYGIGRRLIASCTGLLAFAVARGLMLLPDRIVARIFSALAAPARLADPVLGSSLAELSEIFAASARAAATCREILQGARFAELYYLVRGKILIEWDRGL